ncbi:extracellular solute-binding protein [Paenibacillus sp. J5C_2022]|uniref:extracellular solute-binding protein n=1 Tax=Paenibacillus sp. J5C2022 TaxID=2977129 RepID=UPI0021CE2114|nr:extracellular solute-binding protein [Paenibacillus sp. J5C2022]MCU6712285.1 extracellular solute-binding protein [Paenibacillus sp. J5C2022]
MTMNRNSKKTRSWLSVAMGIVLVLSLALSACSNNAGTGSTGNTGGKTDTTEGKSNSGNGEGTGKDGGDASQSVYPLMTDKTFEYWGAINGNLITFATNLADSPIGKAIAEATGVNVKYIHPSEGQGVEQFNLMIASSKLPDAIEYTWTDYPGGPEKAIADGVIIPLNDLIDQYAPNLKKLLASDPELDKMVKTDSGQYYAFPMVRNNAGVVFRGPMLRKDWLDELGLEVPETVDDWYNVLKAFKEKKGAAAPFTAQYANRMNIQDAFYGAYHTSYDFYIDDAGEVRYGPLDPQFKDVLSLFRKWYSEGLIDKDFPIVDRKTLDKRILNNEAGATVFLLGGGMGGWLESATEEGFDLIGAPYPVLKEGEKPFTGQRDFKYNPKASVAVTTSSKNPELVVQWLDYAYSEEGSLLYNFGIEGESYEMKDGIPTFTDMILKNDKYTSQQMLSQYTIPNGPYQMHENKSTNTYPQQDEAVKVWANTDAAKHILPAFITPTVDESKQVAQIMTEIGTYYEEMFIKFVMGDESLDNYDSFVKQIESMGIQDVIRIKQDALDRYNNR